MSSNLIDVGSNPTKPVPYLRGFYMKIESSIDGIKGWAHSDDFVEIIKMLVEVNTKEEVDDMTENVIFVEGYWDYRTDRVPKICVILKERECLDISWVKEQFYKYLEEFKSGTAWLIDHPEVCDHELNVNEWLVRYISDADLLVESVFFVNDRMFYHFY